MRAQKHDKNDRKNRINKSENEWIIYKDFKNLSEGKKRKRMKLRAKNMKKNERK